jgi:hypothetical protein
MVFRKFLGKLFRPVLGTEAVETTEHMSKHPLAGFRQRENLGKLTEATDHFTRYFSSQFDPELVRENGLTLTDRFPEAEELFAAEDPIELHQFALDSRKRYWLVKSTDKPQPCGYDWTVELAYELSREIDVPLLETRIVKLGDKFTLASRFLPNALSYSYLQKYQHVDPEKLGAKVQENLSALWPFRYFMGMGLDEGQEYVFTRKGNVAFVDYSPQPCHERFDEVPLYSWMDFPGTDMAHLNDSLALETIDNILALPDESIKLMVEDVAKRAAFGKADPAYVESVFETLIARKEKLATIAGMLKQT